MPINEAGRQQLIADLREQYMHYAQTDFYYPGASKTPHNSCGAVMCMAGLCLLRKLGWKEFVRIGNTSPPRDFGIKCLDAGMKQLGIEAAEGYKQIYEPFTNIIPIFNTIAYWPLDLRDKWHIVHVKALSKEERQKELAEIAIEALMRLNDDGSIAKGVANAY